MALDILTNITAILPVAVVTATIPIAPAMAILTIPAITAITAITPTSAGACLDNSCSSLTVTLRRPLHGHVELQEVARNELDLLRAAGTPFSRNVPSVHHMERKEALFDRRCANQKRKKTHASHGVQERDRRASESNKDDNN